MGAARLCGSFWLRNRDVGLTARRLAGQLLRSSGPGRTIHCSALDALLSVGATIGQVLTVPRVRCSCSCMCRSAARDAACCRELIKLDALAARIRRSAPTLPILTK
jgi:hypothetical protein